MPEIPPPSDDLDQLKRALAALKKARARIDALEQARVEPIAIIGIGCRLPGDCETPEAFWQFLRAGRSAMREVPSERWDAAAYRSTTPDEPGKMQSSLSGFLSQIDQFDPHFFGISPREGNAMDPQQRLALEAAWEALEDAGILPASLAGSAVGVYIGIGINDYGRLQIPAQAADPTLMDNYFIQGNALCITANRISYALDLRGPSMAIDTACSSSLVAMHTACQSLRSGESTLALVGGSNIILAPDNSIGLGKFLAPDGLCKTFDARADGYTRGEGSIIFVLRRLSEAEAAGDRIYAVIRGSAVNQDGFSSGLTVPNGAAQEAMLRSALKNAGVEPGEVDYIESHGTGTALGDPIEANALGAVFAPGRAAGQELWIGSVKTNIGHLEAGAGIAGALKAVLALYHGEIPPSLNYLRPNPLIDFDTLRLRVATELLPWPRRERPRRAGISSFGFGGVNAHVILEEAPQPQPISRGESGAVAAPSPIGGGAGGESVFPLSAKTPPALLEAARRFAEFFAAHPELSLETVGHTLRRRRTHFAQRLAVTAASLDELRAGLAAFAAAQPAPNLVTGQAGRARPKIAFLFTGQGSQYVEMGRQLFDSQPIFRSALERCDEILQKQGLVSILGVLYPNPEQPPAQPGAISPGIDDTTYTQPALFALEYALAELWKSWGVEPDVVMGHSVGEFAAAVVAGAMSLEDGLKLIAARGRLMGALPAGGAMAAVFAPLERVQAAISKQGNPISIGAINGPDSTVISGEDAAVQQVLAQLAAEGVKSRPLVVSHAFHSALMEPMLNAFETVAAGCRFLPPRIGLISNVSGRAFESGQPPSAAYWRQHVRAPVNFAAGMQTLYENGVEIFVEIGPHPTLLGMGKRCLPENFGVWLPSLRQGQPENLQMLKSLGALHCQGGDVRWPDAEGERGFPPVSLPTYPFQRERYWFKLSPVPARKPAPANPLAASRLRSPALQGAVFETELDRAVLAYLWDHRAYDTVIFPAAGYIEMILTALRLAYPGQAYTLQDFAIQEALILAEEGAATLQVILTPADDGALSARIHAASPANGAWRLHAEGRLTAQPGALLAGSLAEAQAACVEAIDPAGLYARFEQSGMQYGPAFQNIRRAWRGSQRALAQAQLPENLNTTGYTVHPALLDACLQAVGVLLPGGQSETYLPLDFESIHLSAAPGGEAWSAVSMRQPATGGDLLCDISLYAADGAPLGQLAGLRLTRASRAALQRLAQRSANRPPAADWLYRMAWKPQPLAESTPALPPGWLVVCDPAGVHYPLAEALAALLPAASLAPASPVPPRPVQADTHGVVFLGGVEQALGWLQAMSKLDSPPALWLISVGAQAVISGDVAVEAAGLWGFARSARRELPDMRLRCVDLDPASLPESNARALRAELPGADDEDEVAYRNDLRFVSRMEHWTPAAAAAPQRLEIIERGVLDNLALRPMERRPLQAGEVEIRVRAAGLNFRDVLNTLGMYPGDAGGLGSECAGIVSAVGEEVTHVRPGDAVLALADECFAAHAVARSELTVCKPAAMSFEQAATIPIAFLTAHFALNTLGKMQPGESALIHAAAGGVGLAAVQLAQMAGVEIFATAGSPEKRALLHRLGVAHVLDSRTLDFAPEIMHLTGGAGVHLALNSLADDFIPMSLGVMQNGGRFLEIGKRGIWTHEQVAALGKDIDYHIIYLGEVCEQNPALVGGLLRQLMGWFAEGKLQPLPWRAFPLTQAVDAFRFMAQARHVGKIVLTLPADPALPASIRPDAAYLITGGLGGLGLAAAEQLVDAGARHVLLVGRSEPSEEAAARIQRMILTGAKITPLAADISQAAEVQRVFDILRKNHPPLAGIIHAAGVLEDGLLAQQTPERFARVRAPKLDAALHLHQQTAELALDFFVCYSAGAGWLGSPGQAGYAAANTALDALMLFRQARGLPGLALAWGPWSDAGMAARMSAADQERMARQGLGTISPAEGGQVLAGLLGAGGAAAALPVDWALYGASQERVVQRFSDLTRQAQAKPAALAQAQPAGAGALHRLNEAAPNKRKPLLQAHVREQAIRVLGLNATFSLDARQPLREIGMDSLMAVELRNALGSTLSRKLPATLLFDYPTVEALTDFLALELWPAEKPSAPEPEPKAQTPTADVAKLSDEEAEALLLAELEAMQSSKKKR